MPRPTRGQRRCPWSRCRRLRVACQASLGTASWQEQKERERRDGRQRLGTEAVGAAQDVLGARDNIGRQGAHDRLVVQQGRARAEREHLCSTTDRMLELATARESTVREGADGGGAPGAGRSAAAGPQTAGCRCCRARCSRRGAPRRRPAPPCGPAHTDTCQTQHLRVSKVKEPEEPWRRERLAREAERGAGARTMALITSWPRTAYSMSLIFGLICSGDSAAKALCIVRPAECAEVSSAFRSPREAEVRDGGAASGRSGV